MKKNQLKIPLIMAALALGSMAARAQSPGGVPTAAWYRADAPGTLFSDDGVTQAADSTAIYRWNEYNGTGYDLTQTNAGNRPLFSNAKTLANFNPTVTFTNDYMGFQPAAGVNIIDRADGTLYAAGFANTLTGCGFFGFDESNDYPGLHMFAGAYNLLFFTGGPGYQGLSPNSFTAKSYFTAGAGWVNGAGSSAAYASATVSLNGSRADYSGTQLQNAIINDASRDIRIGWDNNYGALDGQLNELMIFEDKLTASQMDQVESYLAIKYGTTYADGSKDYKNSSGSTVWNIITNNSYNNNIAGIARDDNGALYQRQSWSANAGKQVLISTTGLANTNAANTGTLTDGQYLIWGDNGLAKYPSVAETNIAGTNYRFGSVWKVQNTGAVGTVRVAWPAQFATIKLVQSADPAFASGNTVTDMTANTQVVNGVTYNYADVTLEDGQYFTFAAFVQAPGGVAIPAVWLKADAGVDTLAGHLDQWQNFGLSGGIAEQIQSGATTYDAPYYKQNIHNFNPSLIDSVTNANGGLELKDVFPSYAQRALSTFVLQDQPDITQQRTMVSFVNQDNFAASDDLPWFASQNATQLYFWWQGSYANAYTITNGLKRYNNIPTINSYHKAMWATNPDTTFLGMNGAGKVYAIGNSNTSLGMGQHLLINADGGNNNPSGGNISEVIIYDRDLTATERLQVNSYMAIKYGITLYNETGTNATDYLNSAAQVIWDTTTNEDYNNNITGIANEYNSGLDQKQSRSVNSGRQVLIGTTGLANTNDSNTTSLTDGQFLIWGDNGMARTPSVAISGVSGINFRFASVWKVQNTGSVGTVRVAWPRNTGFASLKLVQSADPTFASGNTATEMTGNTQVINGVTYNYADVTLEDGQYFTFGVQALSPGGIATLPAVWYRSDNVGSSTWEDASVNMLDLTSINGTAVNTGDQAHNFHTWTTGYSNTSYYNYLDSTVSNTNLEVNPVFGNYSDSGYAYMPISIFGVARATSAQAGLISGIDNDNSYGAEPGLGVNPSGGNLYPRFYRFGNGIDNTATSRMVTLNQSSVYYARPYPGGETASGNNNLVIGLNGLDTVIANTNPRSSVAGPYLSIGYSGWAFGAFQGDIQDVIWYKDTLNISDKQKVETYLAINYGTTLAHNYVNAAGDTIYDVSGADSNYHYNIAGIGSEVVNGGLNQRQSNSVNTGKQVLISTIGLANTNDSNASSLAEGQFLIWGDNGLAKTPSVAISNVSGNNFRFAAVWKVRNTGSVDTVRIAWPQNTGFASFKLIQSADPTFASGNTATDMTGNTQVINGVTYNYADVAFEDGQYFTFGVQAVSPGGIATLPAVWYRPDMVSNSKWKDASINSLDLTTQDTSATYSVVVNEGDQVHNFHEWTNGFTNNKYFSYREATNSLFGTWGDGGITTTASADYAGGYYYMPLTVFGVARDTAVSNGTGAITGIDNDQGYGAEPGFGIYAGKQSFYRAGNTADIRNNAAAITSPVNASAVYSWRPPAGGSTASGNDTLLMGTNGAYSKILINKRSSVAGPHINIGTDNYAHPYGFDGNIQEVIWYKDSLSYEDIQKVETYLSLKFGTTLVHNYVNAAGDTVYSITDADSSYRYNIAGIGKEVNNGNLNQRQSNSVNTGSQVLISTTGLDNTNDSNTTSLAEGQFLIWGDNGLAKAPSVYMPGMTGVNVRFKAIWKVQNTGSVGTVRVAWPAGLNNLALMQSADETFDASDAITDMSVNTQDINGVTYNYADVTLSNGQYFTFAANIEHAPGGVFNGLSYWYRADKQTTVTGGGDTTLTSWTDYAMNMTASQISTAVLPKLHTGSATYLNFNPGVNFTLTNQKLGNLSVQTLSGTDFDIFSATKEGMSGSRYFNIGNDNTTMNGNNWDHPGLYADGTVGWRDTAWNSLGAVLPTPAFANNTSNIMYYRFTDSTGNKGLNGAALGTTLTHNRMGLPKGGYLFGANSGAGTGGDDGGFIGNIGELIIYGAGNITPEERNKVDAYLAIKYGITLDTAESYLTSDSAVVWDKTDDAPFYHNVAGIGRDDISALYQKQSRSQVTNNLNDEVTIGLDSIYSDNFSNPDVISNGQFLVWGDNGNTQAMTVVASTYTTFTYNGSSDNRRMNRIWKVRNTNGVNNDVLIRFPQTSVGTTTLPDETDSAGYVIIFASDSSFTTDVSIRTLSANDNDYDAVHTFPDGVSYFTYGKVLDASIPLPIKLLSFTAEKQDKNALLKWVTANEQNNKGFGVERSTDGSKWSSLDFVTTKAENGNSTAPLSYTYSDVKPVQAKNFYRLKEVNLAGKYEYSEIRVVDFGNEMHISIYPNPVKENVTITGLKGSNTIYVSNSIGQVLIRETAVTATENLSTAQLAPGIYMITVQDESNNRYNFKMVKQ